MPTDAEWKARIGSRIRDLRELLGLSLSQLSTKTVGRISKSTLSNYEQGLRMPGPEEATIIAQALKESPAHIMCLDDDMPALTKEEAKLITDLRALPEDQRAQYRNRIALLAAAYKEPVPNERLIAAGYAPAKREASPHRPKVRAGSRDP